MRLGGPIFIDSTDPAVLVKAHQQYGFTAAYCPEVEDSVLRQDLRQAFCDADIVLAEVGAYCLSVLDTNPQRREENINAICRKLAYTDEMGALCCVMHGGSIETGQWGSSDPANISRDSFDRTVTAIQRIIDTVQPQRAKLTVEMTSWLFPYNVDTYLEMITAIDRPAFGVHLDPINILGSPVDCYRNGAIIADCFARLGPHIVSCHAKDIIVKNVYEPIKIRETIPGKGLLDFTTYLNSLSKLPQEPPLMIEHISPEDFPQGLAYIKGIAKQEGLSFRNMNMA